MKGLKMKKKSKFFYSSLIKLGIGLGDWTKLKPANEALDSIEISSVDTNNFDFLSKEELKDAHIIHYALSDLISTHFSKDMNVKVELHTVMMTQMSYVDFIQSVNSNVFQVEMGIPDFGNIHVIFGANLASLMVNRLVGGKGSHETVEQFNDLERDILHTQFKEISPYFQKVWNDIFDINTASITLDSGNYKVDKGISQREAFVIFTFYLYFGGGELYRFMVAMPTEVLRRFITANSKKARTIQQQIALKDSTLKKIEYDVVAQLGASNLTMGDIRSLEVGDVVPLANTLDQPITLFISDKVKLFAQPCVRNNKLACQVIGIDHEDEIPIKLVPMKVLGDETASMQNLDTPKSVIKKVQTIKVTENLADPKLVNKAAVSNEAKIDFSDKYQDIPMQFDLNTIKESEMDFDSNLEEDMSEIEETLADQSNFALDSHLDSDAEIDETDDNIIEENNNLDADDEDDSDENDSDDDDFDFEDDLFDDLEEDEEDKM